MLLVEGTKKGATKTYRTEEERLETSENWQRSMLGEGLSVETCVVLPCGRGTMHSLMVPSPQEARRIDRLGEQKTR